jgi:DNA repair protein RadC
MASNAPDVPALRELLTQQLPLNSVISRRRAANYLINRFFPTGQLDRDLVLFANAFSGQRALKEAIFYVTCANEPIVAKTADEVVWPAMAEGMLSRQRLCSGVEARLAVEKQSVTATAQAIVRTYRDLEVAEATPKLLRLRLRDGDMNAFVFMLHREYPAPGMYELDGCFNGPLHRRLLWSKDWIRSALYRLREAGLISKVTEIDQVRQFSTKYAAAEAMEKWLSIVKEERT